MTETALISQLHDAMVIGAGAAGVGVAVTLHHAGVNDFYVLDRDTVGASFERCLRPRIKLAQYSR